eukprot:609526-Prorocentrum_minimum.AAC.1
MLSLRRMCSEHEDSGFITVVGKPFVQRYPLAGGPQANGRLEPARARFIRPLPGAGRWEQGKVYLLAGRDGEDTTRSYFTLSLFLYTLLKHVWTRQGRQGTRK